MKARSVLYYALWPVEVLAFVVQGFARFVWMLIIVSNPLFLAIYLMSRRKRDGKEEDSR